MKTSVTSMRNAVLCAGLGIGLIISACGSDPMPNATGGAAGSTTGGNTTKVCEPGSSRACYSGPMGTDGIGMCKAGAEVCNADGTGYEECSGEVAPRPEDCATAEDEDCDGLATCSNHVWSLRFGDADTQFVSAISVDAGDNIVLTGQLSGAADFGGGAITSAGSIDLFVAKLDATGKHMWSKRFGDAAGSQTGMSVATDKQGNIIVAGYFDGTIDFGGGPLTSAGTIDIFVAKLDAAGNHVWSKRFGDAGPQAGTMVATTPEGDVVLMSALGGSVDFGGGPVTSAGGFDIGLAKLDATGKHVWSKRFGDPGEQSGNAIAVDAAGNVLMTGMFLGTINFGGGAFTDQNGGDVFVLKLNAAGDHVLSKQFGGAGTQFGYDIAPAENDGIVLVGTFFDDFDLGGGPLVNAGDEDIFVAKLDAAGNHVWSRGFGDEEQQTARGLSVDGGGNIVITGSLLTKAGVDFGVGPVMSGGGSDAFVAKFDGKGTTLWSLRFGDAPNQDGYDTGIDTMGNVVLAGVFRGSVDFGGGPLTTAGDYDLFLAKLAP
jgi:hypothetical protein